MSDFSFSSLSSRWESLLLGRLGSELALIYHDALQSPLPPALRALIERLDATAGQGRRESAERQA